MTDGETKRPATAPPSLRFTHWRALPARHALPGEHRSLRGRTLLDLAGLGDVDRRQLVACAGRGSELRFTVEELFSDGFGLAGGDADWIRESTDVPFEWWDVVDELGAARFQAWFYNADCALVFPAGTTDVVLQGIQFGSAWEVVPALSADLRIAFAEAQRAAMATYPDSDLAQHFAFEP